MTSMGRPQDFSYKHNTKHITVALFLILLKNILRDIPKS